MSDDPSATQAVPPAPDQAPATHTTDPEPYTVPPGAQAPSAPTDANPAVNNPAQTGITDDQLAAQDEDELEGESEEGDDSFDSGLNYPTPGSPFDPSNPVYDHTVPPDPNQPGGITAPHTIDEAVAAQPPVTPTPTDQPAATNVNPQPTDPTTTQIPTHTPEQTRAAEVPPTPTNPHE